MKLLFCFIFIFQSYKCPFVFELFMINVREFLRRPKETKIAKKEKTKEENFLIKLYSVLRLHRWIMYLYPFFMVKRNDEKWFWPFCHHFFSFSLTLPSFFTFNALYIINERRPTDPAIYLSNFKMIKVDENLYIQKLHGFFASRQISAEKVMKEVVLVT